MKKIYHFLLILIIGVVTAIAVTAFTGPGTRQPGQGDPDWLTGVIVMWSGTLSSIPSGWALCDGTNGTPDLREKFIYGWTAGQNPGATGGSTSHSHTVDAHTHSMGYAEVRFGPGTGSPIVSGRYSEHDGTGRHFFLGRGTDAARTEPTTWSHPYDYNRAFLQLQNPNTQTASPATNSASHLPPYYKLAFIMKL